MGVVLRLDLFSDSVHVHGLGIVQRNMKFYVNIIFLFQPKYKETILIFLYDDFTLNQKRGKVEI